MRDVFVSGCVATPIFCSGPVANDMADLPR